MSDATTPAECPVCGAPAPPGSAAVPCAACGHGEGFTYSREGGATVVRLTDKLSTVENLDRFGVALDALGDLGGDVVLDFDGVDFVSSSVIAKLIRLRKLSQTDGRRVSLRRLNPDLLELFKLTRLDQIFEIDEG